MLEKGKGLSSTPSLNITESKQAEEELTRLSEAVRMSADSIVISDVEGKIIYVNEATLKMYGTDDPKDLLGKSSFELIAPEDREKAFAGMKEVMERGYDKDREYHVTTKSGSKILTEMSTSLVKSKTGEAVCFVGITRDITERKQMEEVLRESEMKYKLLFESSGSAITYFDTEGKCIFLNRRGTKYLGGEAEDFIGKSIYDIFPETANFYVQRFTKIMNDGKGDIFEDSVELPDGKRWFSSNIQPVKDESGTVRGIQIISDDITERKRAEEALKESEEKLRTFMETASDLMNITDKDGKCTYVNDSMARTLGYSKEEMVEMHINKLLTKESLEKDFKPNWDKFITNGEISLETTLLTKDGKEVCCEIKAIAVYDSDGNYVGSRSVHRDITERKRAEEALQESEASYRDLADSITDIFFAFDSDLRYTYWNKASEQLTGVSAEDALGKHLYDIFPRDEQTRAAERVYLKALRTKQPQHFGKEYQLGGKDFFFEISAYPTKSGLSVFTKDITERKQAERQIKNRLVVEDAIARASRLFACQQNVDIKEILRILGEAISVNRAYVFQFRQNGRKVDNTHEWCAPGTEPQIDNLQDLDSALVPWWMKKLGAGENIVIPDVGALPAEAAAEKEMLQAQHIRSLLVVPIHSTDGILVGFMGFDDTEKCREWSSEDVSVLRVIAETMASYLERKRLEQDLNERVKKLQCLYGIARIDERPGITPDELYQEVANLLPASWQYPEITCARIVLNDKKFETENYKETKWKQSSDIKVYLAKAGLVEVSYLEERLEIDEGPFSMEERLLIDAVAKQLGNITERKRMEEALMESEQKYRTLAESTADAIFIQDRDGRYLYVNQACAEFLGRQPDRIAGSTLTDFFPEEDARDMAKLIESAFQEESTVHFEHTIPVAGSLRHFSGTLSPIYDSGGNMVSVVGVSRDITERKKREQLQHDENYVLTLLGRGAELSELLDAIVRLGEYHDPSIKGSMLLLDPSRECLVQASAPSLPDDYNELLKNGLLIGPNVGSCGTAAYLKERVIVSDIENSPLFKPFEEAVKRAISNGLLSCWSQPIISSNGDLLGTIANYSNKVGEPNADSLRVLEWSARIAAIAIERKRMEKEIQDKNEQLEMHNEELRATDEELRAANEELRDAQEKLVRSERLAAIGQLAGGVGHELRNPLSAIKNAVYYVRGKVIKSELGNKEPRVIEFLDIVDEEINSSSKIINDLLEFSRIQKPSVSPTRIEKVINGALSYTTIPENIKLTKNLDTDLPEVKIDTDQVRQVLVNMIINAAQAMPDGGGLTISAGEKDKFLEVEIADTGCGIPQEVMDKIFDPLFTTRAKGIGLGLAVCKAIIDRHQGYIEVESKVGKETIFTIKLPLEAE